MRRTEHRACRIKLTVRDSLRVSLQCSFEFPRLPVPDLDGAVVAGGSDDGVERVECHRIDAVAVACKGMLGRAGSW